VEAVVVVHLLPMQVVVVLVDILLGGLGQRPQ